MSPGFFINPFSFVRFSNVYIVLNVYCRMALRVENTVPSGAVNFGAGAAAAPPPSDPSAAYLLRPPPSEPSAAYLDLGALSDPMAAYLDLGAVSDPIAAYLDG